MIKLIDHRILLVSWVKLARETKTHIFVFYCNFKQFKCKFKALSGSLSGDIFLNHFPEKFSSPIHQIFAYYCILAKHFFSKNRKNFLKRRLRHRFPAICAENLATYPQRAKSCNRIPLRKFWKVKGGRKVLRASLA